MNSGYRISSRLAIYHVVLRLRNSIWRNIVDLWLRMLLNWPLPPISSTSDGALLYFDLAATARNFIVSTQRQ